MRIKQGLDKSRHKKKHGMTCGNHSDPDPRISSSCIHRLLPAEHIPPLTPSTHPILTRVTPQEIYPLLPLLLTELSKLHHRAEEVSIKNILVELCLTVPARLASLLPHLPLMMRLMVHALRCRGDLDGLALRTLEFWVDNLNPDYLYKIMSHDPKVHPVGF